MGKVVLINEEWVHHSLIKLEKKDGSLLVAQRPGPEARHLSDLRHRYTLHSTCILLAYTMTMQFVHDSSLRFASS